MDFIPIHLDSLFFNSVICASCSITSFFPRLYIAHSPMYRHSIYALIAKLNIPSAVYLMSNLPICFPNSVKPMNHNFANFVFIRSVWIVFASRYGDYSKYRTSPFFQSFFTPFYKSGISFHNTLLYL